MRIKKITLLLLVLVLAFVLLGCGNGKKENAPESNSFTFEVYDISGELISSRDITASDKYVGQSLLESGLISGEDGPYGLYVKEVDGITADYDSDGIYWAFYVNGEYALSGVDTTEVENGSVYAFKIEK